MLTGSPFNPVSLPEQAISHLFVLVLLLMAGILILVAGLIAYILCAYRSQGPEEPRQTFGDARLEAFWTVAPALLLVWVFALTVRTMRAADPPAGSGPPDIQIIAHQWWWEVRYPAAGVIGANEIHLPANQPMLAEFTSGDVIHDFWVPELGRKIDVVPGHPNHLWLTPDRAGTFLGTCAEFCGAEHAWMRIRVIAETPAAFSAWLAAQARIPPPPTDAAAAAGSVLFHQLSCVNCHAIAGAGANARIGPDLTHVASRQTLAAGRLDNTPADLTAWLRNPAQFKPGSHMPNLRLSPPQLQELTAYLETLH